MTDLARVAFVLIAAAVVWFGVREPLWPLSVVGIGVTLAGGFPIFKEALENLRERKMTMELSMTIAIVAALGIGEYFTALIITAFVLAAEVLEGLTVSRGRLAIATLLAFLPRTALVRRDGAATLIGERDLRVGDLVLVNPGALVPVDGVVVGGHSFVDQAHVTGESMAVEKTPGEPVYAGTFNQAGALEVRAERIGRDTSFGKIVEAVESAERSRAPIEKLADRLAGYIVYFALAAAFVTLLVTRDVRATIAVVIVAGACGIAAGTPLAVLGAIGRAARAGAIVKGGRFMEALATVDTVVLDKTGTLTFGVPVVRELLPADGVSERELLEVAAIAERRSEHPLGKAIVVRADAEAIDATEPDSLTYTPGRGLCATARGEEILAGNRAMLGERGVAFNGARPAEELSEILVARDGRYLGVIGIADEARPEAASAIAAMQSLGLRTIMLSGDTAAIARAVGRSLGIDEVAAELMPDEKRRRVEALVEAGRIVAMVGDGINDAPALSAATVGVAMGSGTDVARESADVVLLGNDLERFVETLRIARRARRIIMQNFVGTLAVDAVGMGFAAMGLLGPLPAAFVHVASELAFILNATRMLPGTTRRARAGGPSDYAS